MTNDHAGGSGVWWPAWGDLQRWVELWRPEMNLPVGLNPLVTLGSLLALVATTGVAIASMALLIASLLALYLLLTQVFGFRFELGLR